MGREVREYKENNQWIHQWARKRREIYKCTMKNVQSYIYIYRCLIYLMNNTTYLKKKNTIYRILISYYAASLSPDDVGVSRFIISLFGDITSPFCQSTF